LWTSILGVIRSILPSISSILAVILPILPLIPRIVRDLGEPLAGGVEAGA